MKKFKKKKLIIIISVVIALLLLIIFLVAPFSISAYMYDSVFNNRAATADYLAYDITEFDGLKADRYTVTSDKGQKLTAYKYYTEGMQPVGVVVIAHGFGGGGHNSYMDCANYFAHNGFYAFAYDATGNDESEGDKIGGLPQGVADLDYVLSYLETVDEFKDLPIFLFGHSWGAYCVTSVLNYHPEVKAVVSLAGFNCSSDMLNVQGVQMFGGITNFLMPYVKDIESLRFGKYAKATAMGGFANSEAKVMVVQGKNDTVVPQQYGYDIYWEKYQSDSRFKFVYLSDRGHNDVFYSDTAINYINDFNAASENYFADKSPTDEEFAEYVKQNLDRNIWCNLLDGGLFAEIVQFYNSAIKNRKSNCV